MRISQRPALLVLIMVAASTLAFAASASAATSAAIIRWSRPTLVDPVHTADLGPISCPTARFCAAAIISH